MTRQRPIQRVPPRRGAHKGPDHHEPGRRAEASVKYLSRKEKEQDRDGELDARSCVCADRACSRGGGASCCGIATGIYRPTVIARKKLEP